MRMALADRLSAVVFIALGLALLIGGWTMDRLEIRQIHPASIPGLVPMILGLALLLCAGLLAQASFKPADRNEQRILLGGSWSRLALSTALCLAYALILVGWLSYFWATLVFTFGFALVFSFPVTGSRRDQAIAVAGSLILGIAVAWCTAIMFEDLFLVRLP